MTIKSSAIIYAGYDYQTLQGVKLLAEWLDYPTKYVRMAFEADAKQAGVPQGIDDIVCERHDGKTDFFQVKFSPDASKEDNQLSWEWLLKISGKTNRSRSILQKIADAITQIPEEKRGDVILLTNKVPDRDMETCLQQYLIDFSKVTDAQRNAIIGQLGSEERAEQLFTTLQVRHSDQGYTRLDIIVRELLRKHTNEDGVYRLVDRAKNWAIQHNTPSDGGWIRLEHIRSVISPNRPEPIPQSFEVPENYIVPDVDFHENFLDKLFTSEDHLIVLTGAPGKGKSTYISHVCQTLQDRQFPYIRHHYFLSLHDRTPDRLSLRIVAEDLISQVEAFCPEVVMENKRAEDLHQVLNSCGQVYQEKGLRFFIIVDGLDHVWRDNGRDKSPLDELFLQLLPLPDNVTLLIGTQPTDDELLPSRLLQACPRERWHDLPSMTGNAIKQYLSYQVESERIAFHYHQSQYETELSQCAELLTTKTQGYPLHVIYSCEQLHAAGRGLSRWQIESLPRCEGGNIASYYQELWKALKHAQRDVLHLCCAFPFLWPTDAFAEILDESVDDTPGVNAVIHLLYESIAGLRPFHESLVVFTRGTSEHDKRICALLPALISWIEKSAPEPIKECWLWSCIARSGNTAPMRNGLTRDWVLDRLAEGYQREEFIRLFSQAESFALVDGQFHEAYQHRARKIRLLNAWLQIWDMPTLAVCSLAYAPDVLLNQHLATKNVSSPKALATLALALWFRERHEEAGVIAKLALRRYSSESSVYTERNGEDTRADIRLLIKAAVLTERFNEQWLETSSLYEWDQNYIRLFIESAEFKADIGLLFALHRFLPSKDMKTKIENAIVRTGIIAEIELKYWPQFEELDCDFVNLYRQLPDAHPVSLVIEQGESGIGRYHVFPAVSYNEWFFGSLLCRLKAGGDFCWLPVKAEEERIDIAMHYHSLNDFADIVVEGMALGVQQSFSDFCALLGLFEHNNEQDYHKKQKRIFFKSDWINIALNLYLLCNHRPVHAGDLSEVLENGHVELHWIRKTLLNCPSKVVETASVEKLLQYESMIQATKLEETNQCLERNIELADIALRYNLGRSTVTKLTKICWDYGLGYGYHKDISLNQALAAVECITAIEPKYALTQLDRLSPLVDNVCNFTDGDETRHAVTEFSAICAKISLSTLSSIYDDYISKGEWYDADNALNHYLKQTDFSSPFVIALCRTLLNIDQIKTIQERVDPNTELATLWDGAIPNTVKEDNKNSNWSSENKFEPNSIRPEDVEQLVTAKSNYDNTLVWYQYWKAQGEVATLVRALLPVVKKSLPQYSQLKYLLEPLFEDTLRLKGKKQAYPVLVQEHIHKDGWGEWGESDEKTYARLDKVIHLYPDKINDFIRETTQFKNLQTKEDNLVIPSNKLIYLLANVGRLNEAKALCEAIIAELEAETRNLPLKKPDWKWEGELDNEMITVKFIIQRMFWPVQCVKRHVAEQLAILLVNSNRTKDIENLLTVELSSRQLESEAVDILTVFWLASLKGFQLQSNISSAINAGSFLSDTLLDAIIPNYTNQSHYQSFPEQPDDTGQTYGFEKIEGNELPTIFLNEMKRLQEKTGVPASFLMKQEWANICHVHQQRWEQVDYFFSTERKTFTGSFATRNTRFGISAYLRTINRLMDEYDMPPSYASHYSTCAMAASPLFYAVSNRKPNWIPVWRYGQATTEDNIREYIQECLSTFSIDQKHLGLGALSVPVHIDTDTWLDITTVLAVQTEAVGGINFAIKCGDCGYSVDDLLQPFRQIHFSLAEWAEYHQCLPLFGSTRELARIARWDMQHEFRGLFAPMSKGPLIARPYTNHIAFDYQGRCIGHSDFWRVTPLSTYPKDIRSPVATYTAYDQNHTGHWLSEVTIQQPRLMLCEIKVLKREHSHQEFGTADFRFYIKLK